MSEEKIYPWKRFWLPFDDASTISNDTYLKDPDSKYGHILVPNAVTLDHLTNIPCLILRAEPGMGKTFEMKKAYQSLNQAGYKVEEFNLGESSEGGLNRFFDSDIFTEWRNGEYILHLFLDGLDEGLLTVASLSERLIRELKKSKTHLARLCLRIACRTSVFPDFLKDELIRLFPVKESPTSPRRFDYFLAPLREVDVRLAAQANSIDAERFIKEVRHAGVEAFAVRPVTLDLLLSALESGDSTLPVSRRELYEKGCLKLCAEPNRNRRIGPLRGEFTHQERFKLAAQVAAATILCNKPKIWRDDSPTGFSNKGEDIVPLSEFAEASGITQAGLCETLDTALFRVDKENTQAWSHQTYAEFLAAYFLKNFAFTQLRSLFIAEDGKIFPQLHETAAWTASFNRDFFQYLAENDPFILFSTDPQALRNTDREKLTQKVLNTFANEERSNDWDFWGRYHHLEHPNLHNQLRPYIQDKNQKPYVRKVAIRIAVFCPVSILQNVIADLILDTEENLELRIYAAEAINHIIDKDNCLRLKELIFEESENYVDEELKVNVLKILIENRCIDVREVFQIISSEKKLLRETENFLGSDFVSRFTLEDIPQALNWINSLPPYTRNNINLQKLKEEVLNQSFQFAYDKEVCRCLADTIISRTLVYDYLTLPSIDQEEIRKNLAIALIKSPKGKKEKYIGISFVEQLIKNNFLWYFEQIEKSSDTIEIESWVSLAIRYFDFQDNNHLEALVLLGKKYPTVNDLIKEFLQKAQLNNKIEDTEKQQEKQWEEEERKEKERSDELRQKRPERIVSHLQSILAGDLGHWHQLVEDLKCNEENRYNEESPELTLESGWQNSTSEIKKQIQLAALKFILEQELPDKKWIADIKHFYPICRNGFRAFFLLAQTNPSLLSQLESGHWSKWAGSLLTYPISTESKEQEVAFSIQKDLLKTVFSHSPQSVLEAFSARLAGLQTETPHEYEVKELLKRIAHLWDFQWESLLLRILTSEGTTKSSRWLLLDALLEQGSEKASLWGTTLLPELQEDLRLFTIFIRYNIPDVRSFARSLLSKASNGLNTPMAVEVAQILIESEPTNNNWQCIWNLISQSKDHGKVFFENFFFSDHRIFRSNFFPFSVLSNQDLVSFYLWMAHEYPPHEDPDHRRQKFFTPGIRDQIASFRSTPLNVLIERGTLETVKLISDLVVQNPNLKLGEFLFQCQESFRRKSWQPPIPKELFELSKHRNNQGRRLILSESELLGCIIESLERGKKLLQGENALAKFLWEPSSQKPRGENDFSDALQFFLRTDLSSVVILREVEIRSSAKGNNAQRTDLYVTTFPPDKPENRVTVIIEVKGSWHDKLLSAMETQLVDDYLKNNQCRHGLYVVGWFNCDFWEASEKPRRKSFTQAPDIVELQKKLDDQAAALSIKETLTVKALVLDCSLPDAAPTEQVKPQTVLTASKSKPAKKAATKIATKSPRKAASKKSARKRATPITE